MGIFKRSKLVVAYSPIFKRQSAFDSPIANTDLTAAMPLATLPTFRTVEREQRDCRGRIMDFPVDTRLVEWTFEFAASQPQFVFGWLAFYLGQVAAPTGSPASETQTLTVSGTGNYKVGFAYEGLSSQSENIPHNATATVIQAALQKMRSVKEGNVTVTGASSPFTLALANKLANANVPLFTTDNTGMTGGTAAIALGANGSQRVHAATRATSDNLVLTSLIYGFEGDTQAPIKLINLGVDSITLTLNRRGDVSMRLVLIGSAMKYEQAGYVLPACTTFTPLKTEDCRLLVSGNYYNDDLREVSRVFTNNILRGPDSFPFDSPNIAKIERQDESEFVPETITFNVFGSDGDTLHTTAESRSTVNTTLMLGAPGDRCEIISPSTFVRLDEQDVQFTGDGNRSAIYVNGSVLTNSGIGGAYSTVNGYLSQSTAFLTT